MSSANSSCDFGGDELSGASSRMFITNDILAFKSKKDFIIETEESNSVASPAYKKLIDLKDQRFGKT